MQSSSPDNCVHHYGIGILDLFDLEPKKRYDHKSMHKVFHSFSKLIASDSDIDGAFKSLP